MDNLVVDTLTADLHSDWEGLEPALSWNRRAQQYNTTTSRMQLGANLTEQPLNDRGVLVLSPRSEWQPFFSEAETAVNAWVFTLAIANSLRDPQSVGEGLLNQTQTGDLGVLLSRTPTTIDFNAHQAHVGLFQDTLNQTQSPAVALQALLTRICQMIYYEQLLRLEETGHANVTLSHAAMIPTRWTGFGVGMGLLLSHWVVVGIVAALFARYTRHSLLGNHWQVVSQVYSKETAAVLEEADRMDDREVKRWVEGRGQLYSVVGDEGKGRVALTARNPDQHLTHD
jgi:hypothetical protein